MARESTTLNNVPLSNGVNNFSIRSTDIAGNQATVAISITRDSATANPTALLASASDTGLQGDNITNLATVTIQGTAEPGALVEIVGTALNATANGSGTTRSPASRSTPVPTTSPSAPPTPPATRQPPTSPSRAIRPPDPNRRPADPLRYRHSWDLITSFASVSIEGTAEAGARVELVGTGLFTTANGSGFYNLTNVPLSLGSNNFTVRSTDIAGNLAELAITIVRDSQAPFININLQNDTAGPNGTNSDGLTSDPTLAGNRHRQHHPHQLACPARCADRRSIPGNHLAGW